ncbi:MAG: hypothetical protein H5U04_12370 [Firmicutes bacterium]|nr:hypothetical protein [Bacillota bacterium]
MPLECQLRCRCPECDEAAAWLYELPEELQARHKDDDEAGWCCFCPRCGEKLCSACV